MDALVVLVRTLKLEIGMQTNSNTFSAGFSLIEIMIVMMIITIVTSSALFAFGDFGQSRRIEANAERIAQKIQLIRHRALLESIPYQIHFSSTTYEISKWIKKNQWSAIQRGSLRYLKQSISKQIILIQPSGDITPITLYFGLPNTKPNVKINVKANGVVSVHKISASE